MSLPVFLTPVAGLVVLFALAPLTAAALRERRLRRVRADLRLAPPRPLAAAATGIAAAATVALLALAAAQPAIARAHGTRVRTDAQAYVVLDDSRSMAAVARRGGPSRLDRARALALRLRDAVPQVPWGVGSFSDRVLVHAFPSPSRGLVADTLAQAIGIERPSPTYEERVATTLGSLSQTTTGFFQAAAKRRVVVLFTDGESRSFDPGQLAAALRPAHVHLVLVRLWSARDRVYAPNGRDLGYRPVDESTLLDRLPAVGIPVVAESSFAAVPGIVRRLLGSGPTATPPGSRDLTPLAPYAVLAGLVPLGFVLLRANR